MPDIKRSAFLRDDASQVLALSDALSSANGPAISAAFDDVARTRGLAQIALQSNIALGDLCRALADPRRPDAVVLAQVVESLIQSLPVLNGDHHPGLETD